MQVRFDALFCSIAEEQAVFNMPFFCWLGQHETLQAETINGGIIMWKANSSCRQIIFSMLMLVLLAAHVTGAFSALATRLAKCTRE